MDELGFIHDKLDIKILILFILQRLPDWVSKDDLAGLCLIDDGISYFDYIDCLDGLVDTKHVLEDNGKYSITSKGRRDGKAVEQDLPFSVRQKAEAEVAGAAAQMRREQMIKTEHECLADGGVKLHLSLSDGVGEILALSLLCASERQASEFSERFKKDAEGYYGRIMDMLSE